MEGLDHGAVVVAAITSCTNTSNPSVMIGAGLLARNAARRGLTTKPWVKTEPRARIARRDRVPPRGGPARAARRARVQPRRLRLHDLHRQQRSAARAGVVDRQGQEPRRRVGAVGQSQLRGTHPVAGARQLPGVAAAGRRLRARRQDADRSDQRAARHRHGRPAGASCATSGRREREIQETMLASVQREMFQRAVRATSSTATHRWQSLAVPQGERFDWDADSTYIRNPPFFDGLTLEPPPQTGSARRARARAARRQRDDRSHLAGRFDPGRQPGGEVADRARRRSRATSTPTARAAATTK